VSERIREKHSRRSGAWSNTSGQTGWTLPPGRPRWASC
jgi:hypothetical protein